MSDDPYGVTVVIPTLGRPELEQCIESVVGQTTPPHRILVATDSSRVDDLQPRLGRFPLVQVVDGGSSSLGGHLRDFATRLVETRFVAYLDDDDKWDDAKLAQQLDVIDDDVWLVSCRSRIVEQDGTPGVAFPAQVFDRTTDVSDWLFFRRQLSVVRNSLHTSTLLMRSEAAKQVGWTPTLKRHQDWDFVLRAAETFGVQGILQSPEVLVRVSTGTGSSVSASADFAPSLDWYLSVQDRFSDRAAADFLVGQVGRYAAMSGDFRMVATMVRRSVSLSRPSPSALGLLLSGLVPRRLFEWLMSRSR